MLDHWLEILCRALPRVRAAAIFDLSNQDGARVVSAWPREQTNPGERLGPVAELVVGGEGTVVSRQREEGERKLLLVARRLAAPGLSEGVLALELEAGLDQQAVILRLLEWSAGFLELPFDGGGADREDPALALIESSSVDEGMGLLAERLAARFRFRQVVAASARASGFEITGLSTAKSFDKRAAWIAEVRSRIALIASAAHIGELVRAESLPEGCAVLVLGHGDRVLGALYIEIGDGLVDEAALGAVASSAGTAIALRQDAARSSSERLRDSVLASLRALVGPRWLGAKFAAALVALTLLVTAFVEIDYEVVAPATVEGEVQRAIVAPFDSYVVEQYVRAGDAVNQGQVMAELDTRDLLLEERKWFSERAEAEKQYRQSLASLDQPQARIFSSRVEQAQAQLELVRSRLARTKLVSPMNGTVISGDLSRSLGAPVKRGDVLYEVAPSRGFRFRVEVADKRIRDVSVGDKGAVALEAFAGKRFSFQVERIGNAVETPRGGIAFAVEGRVTAEDNAGLLPGMSGTARIEAGRRSILWVYGHGVFDWLRLWAWKRLP
ncbi:MAG: efflux RND transporter periplasmic adaptor subunit [Pseudomonadales bacterium]|nr:efflux RND transporter periplasmic adaptor subunit [Pseudomonadales bacterium]